MDFPPEHVVALAAAVQAAATLAIVGLTVAYVRATHRISDANDRMADANSQLIEEMRADRQLAARATSVEAAGELQSALTSAARMWQSEGSGDELTAALVDARDVWLEAMFNNHGVLQSDVLRDDVRRFTRILTAAALSWRAVLGQVESEHGQDAANRREHTDNRPYRLGWCADRLREALAEHRRGDDLTEPRLPRKPWTFWTLPMGASDEDFEGLVHQDGEEL